MHSTSGAGRPWAWLWLVVLAAGCSGDGLAVCTGGVTYDGKPLETGAIDFHPLDRALAPQGGRIVAGRFEVRARPGRYRVEIRASRPKPGAPELTPGMKPHEQFVPPRYNDRTELEAEVRQGGTNEFSFVLEPDRT